MNSGPEESKIEQIISIEKLYKRVVYKWKNTSYTTINKHDNEHSISNYYYLYIQRQLEYDNYIYVEQYDNVFHNKYISIKNGNPYYMLHINNIYLQENNTEINPALFGLE
jgi:hypothetical protein